MLQGVTANNRRTIPIKKDSNDHEFLSKEITAEERKWRLVTQK